MTREALAYIHALSASDGGLGPLALLLVQVTVILALARLMGGLAHRLRQPKVVGEMLAGIVLGPSILGWLAPGAAAALFPPESIELLNVLAQIGVIFFLLLIGLELDPAIVRANGWPALWVSLASIAAPFALGVAIAPVLFRTVVPETHAATLPAVALFMGAAMSATAFPVLARILTERNLQKTRVGSIAITCAAAGDVLAWCMLAVLVALCRAQGWMTGLTTAGLSLAYVLLMFMLVRPLLYRLEALYERHGSSDQAVLAVVLVLALLSAAITDWIGIHALFGAFLAGAIMPPRASFVKIVTARLEDFTVVFLLPVFFAYAGLRTQIGLLDSGQLWLLTGLVVLVACAGKFGGSAVAARSCGMSWRESSAIGILMNTRGLVELVILTIGLQLGIINETIFAMMVIMALVTTAMATPILHWVFPTRMFEAGEVDARTADAEFGVLAPVSRPESGPGLVRVIAALSHSGQKAKIYALTLRPPSMHEIVAISTHGDSADDQALRPLVAEARHRGIACEAMGFFSRDIASDIARVARIKRVDLILMGFHKPVFGQTILGGTVHRVLTGADTDVGVLVDRGLGDTLSVLVPYLGSEHDRLAVALASRMAGGPGVNVTLLHVVPPGQQRASGSLRSQSHPDGVKVQVVESRSPIDAVLEESSRYNLAIVGLGEEWGLTSQLLGWRAERIAAEWPASLLLVRKYVPLPELP